MYDSHGYGQSKQKIRSGKAGGQSAVVSSNFKIIVTMILMLLIIGISN